MIERLESGDYTLADEMTAERQAIIRKASERTQAPPPAVVSTGGRPRPETPDIEPEPDDGRTLTARVVALLHRAGPLNSSQIADLLPGAPRPSVYAACGKLVLRGLLVKTGRGQFAAAPDVEPLPPVEPDPMPEMQPVVEPVAVEAPEPEPEPAARVATTADLVQRHAAQRAPARYSASAVLDGLTLRVEGADAARVASVVAAALAAVAHSS
jgi:hypothetical protein